MEKIILEPNDIRVIQLSLAGLIDQMKETFSDPTIPWTPEARRDAMEILKFAEQAASKIEKISGHAAELGEFKEGDEKEFFTKES